jgi:hypothetical protein
VTPTLNNATGAVAPTLNNATGAVTPTLNNATGAVTSAVTTPLSGVTSGAGSVVPVKTGSAAISTGATSLAPTSTTGALSAQQTGALYQSKGTKTVSARSADRRGLSGWAAALPPPLVGGLALICPQLTLNPNAGCQLPLNPIIKSILASTGGVLPWTVIPGLLLLVAGLAARRRRTRQEQPEPEGTWVGSPHPSDGDAPYVIFGGERLDAAPPEESQDQEGRQYRGL